MEEKKQKKGKIRVVKKYAEAFKKHVVVEIEAGLMTQAEAAREYGLASQSVSEWVAKYGTIKTQYIEVIMKDQKDKIQKLESELANAYLKLSYYDCLLSEMGKDYGFDVKKNTDTGELELVSTSTGEVLKKFVK